MKEVKMNDHEFASHLRKEEAINNYDLDVDHNCCTWRNKKDKLVAIAVYDDVNCTKRIFIK